MDDQAELVEEAKRLSAAEVRELQAVRDRLGDLPQRLAKVLEPFVGQHLLSDAITGFLAERMATPGHASAKPLPSSGQDKFTWQQLTEGRSDKPQRKPKSAEAWPSIGAELSGQLDSNITVEPWKPEPKQRSRDDLAAAMSELAEELAQLLEATDQLDPSPAEEAKQAESEQLAFAGLGQSAITVGNSPLFVPPPPLPQPPIEGPPATLRPSQDAPMRTESRQFMGRF